MDPALSAFNTSLHEYIDPKDTKPVSHKVRPAAVRNETLFPGEKMIIHYDQHLHSEKETENWLPPGKITVGITAGASCPNNLIEDAIRRVFELRGVSVQELLAN